MPKTIEETLKHCKKCDKTTKFYRKSHKTGFVMALIHIVLVIATMGFWLIPLVIWYVLNLKIGGWKCSECGS